MNILIKNVWKEGYLDQTLLDKTVRIKSLAWFNIYKLDGLYFIPEKSWRLLFNYILAIGIKSVVQKIVSRLSESARNEKYVSLGLGLILETKSTLFQKNDFVVFSALCYPQCMERIVIFEGLVNHCSDQWLNETLSRNEILFGHIDLDKTIPEYLLQYKGWSEYSGIVLPSDLKKPFQSIAILIKQALKDGNIRKLNATSTLPNECLYSPTMIDKKKNKCRIIWLRSIC